MSNNEEKEYLTKLYRLLDTESLAVVMNARRLRGVTSYKDFFYLKTNDCEIIEKARQFFAQYEPLRVSRKLRREQNYLESGLPKMFLNPSGIEKFFMTLYGDNWKLATVKNAEKLLRIFNVE